MAYTGQHRDSDTDLQYHRARWLSTEKGRWLSEDPVFDFPANFGNRYGYVGGGPVVGYDLSGNATLLDVAISLAVIAGLTGIGAVIGYGGGLLAGKILYPGDNDAQNVLAWKSAMIAGALTLAISSIIILNVGSVKFLRYITDFTTGFISGILGSDGKTWQAILQDGLVSGLVALLQAVLLRMFPTQPTKLYAAMVAGLGIALMYCYDVFVKQTEEFSWKDFLSKVVLGMLMVALFTKYTKGQKWTGSEAPKQYLNSNPPPNYTDRHADAFTKILESLMPVNSSLLEGDLPALAITQIVSHVDSIGDFFGNTIDLFARLTANAWSNLTYDGSGKSQYINQDDPIFGGDFPLVE